MATETHVGSDVLVTLTDLPKQLKISGKATEAGVEGLSPAAFTTAFIWRANGVHPRVNFVLPGVNANSRVFLNISEYASNPQERFIGNARMAIYNIAPYNGGFFAWVEIAWGSLLNIRFDVFVDP